MDFADIIGELLDQFFIGVPGVGAHLKATVVLQGSVAHGAARMSGAPASGNNHSVSSRSCRCHRDVPSAWCSRRRLGLRGRCACQAGGGVACVVHVGRAQLQQLNLRGQLLTRIPGRQQGRRRRRRWHGTVSPRRLWRRRLQRGWRAAAGRPLRRVRRTVVRVGAARVVVPDDDRAVRGRRYAHLAAQRGQLPHVQRGAPRVVPVLAGRPAGLVAGRHGHGAHRRWRATRRHCRTRATCVAACGCVGVCEPHARTHTHHTCVRPHRPPCRPGSDGCACRNGQRRPPRQPHRMGAWRRSTWRQHGRSVVVTRASTTAALSARAAGHAGEHLRRHPVAARLG